MKENSLQRHPSSRRNQSHYSMACPVQGMENVVATVSGYHGSERFNLIKLISRSGASYVGAMSRSITHLVCWKFEGKKYGLAKKFNTIIVNHKWVEQCIKQGKRISEVPYMLQCGEEVGPLVLEVPIVSMEGELTRKHNVFSEKLGIFGDNIKDSRILGASNLDNTWTDTFFLKEHTESNTHSLRSARNKRNNPVNGMENTCLAESSRKGQRLVKKNASRNIVDLDSDQGYGTSRGDILCDQQNKDKALKYSDAERGVCITKHGETSVHQPCGHIGTPNQGLDDIEEIDNWTHSSAFKVPNSHHVDTSDAGERTPQDFGSDFNKLDSMKQVTEANKNVVSLAPSPEVSCVICWTEFSSRRGILPCGHRFCYSCIQSWADRMVSQRKNSACPLCKASFVTITKVEDAGSSDQKIYSQTVPCPSSTKDISILPHQERLSFGAQSLASVCSKCRFREPEDLLINCHLCNFRCIHSYCLDPFLLPWTCIHCKDMQMRFYNGR